MRHVRARPVAGCPVFPTEQLVARRHQRAPAACPQRCVAAPHVAALELHPDFGRALRRAAGALRHPHHRRSVRRHRKVNVRFDYADESDRVRYPLGTDTKIEGGRTRSDGDRHTIIVDKSTCTLYETCDHPQAQRTLDGRLRCRLDPEVERAAARRLDVGGRRRPADPARAAALERGEARETSTTRSASPPTSPTGATSGRRGTRPARSTTATTRRWARASGSRRRYDIVAVQRAKPASSCAP